MATVAVLDAFTTKEVAEMFGVSRMTIWRAVRDGKLTTRKHAGRNVFYAVDLLDYALRFHQGRGIPA